MPILNKTIGLDLNQASARSQLKVAQNKIHQGPKELLSLSPSFSVDPLLSLNNDSKIPSLRISRKFLLSKSVEPHSPSLLRPASAAAEPRSGVAAPASSSLSSLHRCTSRSPNRALIFVRDAAADFSGRSSCRRGRRSSVDRAAISFAFLRRPGKGPPVVALRSRWVRAVLCRCHLGSENPATSPPPEVRPIICPLLSQEAKPKPKPPPIFSFVNIVAATVALETAKVAASSRCRPWDQRVVVVVGVLL